MYINSNMGNNINSYIASYTRVTERWAFISYLGQDSLGYSGYDVQSILSRTLHVSLYNIIQLSRYSLVQIRDSFFDYTGWSV